MKARIVEASQNSYVKSMTIRDVYPELVQLLADYFAGERARDGSTYRDAVLAFALTESHPTLLRTASDAHTVLSSASELASFEDYMTQAGFDFRELGAGVTVRDWLADVEMLVRSAV